MCKAVKPIVPYASSASEWNADHSIPVPPFLRPVLFPDKCKCCAVVPPQYLAMAIRVLTFAGWLILFGVFVRGAEDAGGVLSPAVHAALIIYALRFSVVPRYVVSSSTRRTPTAFEVLFTIGQPALVFVYALWHALAFVPRVGEDSENAEEKKVLEWWILASAAFVDFMSFMALFACKGKLRFLCRQLCSPSKVYGACSHSKFVFAFLYLISIAVSFSFVICSPF